ncbi:hypothetical protein [Nostoc sp. 'Peltigera membranacea cyanobiont' 232]|uniref:hypothetical protein n=1 Tax=Nostoc sp. 'Peltigera membranacea cyanobiont' 232 TaxID=2014531 RepID=UPI001CB990CB|nr:hypothetical protein [Nostoc sp. 'Peltigera membranacea cyanobiont' 232]
MTQSVYTQQTASSFSYNTSTTVTEVPFKDEQALAQAELNNYIETQAEVVAPTQDPLTSRDRRIIGEIIQVEPESVRTIWLEGGITVWVRFVNGSCLPFDRDWFAKRVAEVKATLPETPLERNERLSDELEEACVKFNLWHPQIDWLSFSTKLYRNNQLVGYIGCNLEGWYSRPRTYGMNRFASSASEAITFLGVRPAVAA